MSWEEHLQHLGNVFIYLKMANQKIKLSECQFFKRNLHYLGHLILEKDIQQQCDKIIAIKNLSEPKSVDELHHFLGLTGYYRKFVPLFPDIMKPLNKLLGKDTKFQWSTQCQSAFETSEECILQEAHPYNIPIQISPTPLFTDVSNYAYSSVLTQVDDGPGDLKPIAYTSSSFSDTQQRWSAIEKETFAIYKSVLKFDLCLRGA